MTPSPDQIDVQSVIQHGLAGTALVSAWVWLPPLMATVASTMAAIFYGIQIYEKYKSLKK